MHITGIHGNGELVKKQQGMCLECRLKDNIKIILDN